MTHRLRILTNRLVHVGCLAFFLVAVLIFQETDSMRAGSVAASGMPPVQGDPSVVGQWSTPANLTAVAIHMHVLPNGKVLFWMFNGSSSTSIETYLWDPDTSSAIPISNTTTNLFCSGHSFRKDGRLLVSGGHIATENGLPDTNIFDFRTNTWTKLVNMNAGRWYPTNTTLANGDVLTMEGTYLNGSGVVVHNQLPQVYQASGLWRSLTNAQQLILPTYPRTFLTASGSVFYAGEEPQGRFLDTSGTGAWSSSSNLLSNYGTRDYGSAVMYDADLGKILIVGGGSDVSSNPSINGRPTNTAEVINLSSSSPSWSYVGSMAYRRRQINATILADGKVLVTGGTSGAGPNNPCGTVLAAEMWDPASPNTWTTMANMGVPRIYHSTAVLLPDGRVLSSGSTGQPACNANKPPCGQTGSECYKDLDLSDCCVDQQDQTSVELYSPPYLFKGAQPVITSAPRNVNYGQTFFVASPNASTITEVNLIRLSSVTHAFNENQRLNHLPFSQTTGGLWITVPANGNVCPPGHYMLFILKGTGQDKVPSVAKIIKVSPRVVDTTIDFDSDRKTDISVWRPSTGTWHIIQSSTGSTSATGWGVSTDVPVPGDYDGDGKTDIAVWRPSEGKWYIIQSSTGNTVYQYWGVSGDIPVPGDYDGDGKTDLAMWRPSDGKWWVLQSSTGTWLVRQWGASGDKPMAFDYDGDQLVDFAYWRPSDGTWNIIQSSTIQSATPVIVNRTWGVSGDMPVPGDYDGDGETDIAVWRPSTGVWHIILSSTGSTTGTSWGVSGDVPVPGDYDADGKTDVAVWRPSEGKWYIIQSSTGNVVYQYWGVSGDIPVPSIYVR